MSDTTPRYVPEDPNERAAMRTRQAVQHHGGPTTGMGAELPFLIQHYYDNAMAGPRAMERIAHGELDPMSPEGIRTGMSAAWSLPMQSPFVPRGSVGVGGGRMSQPPFEPNVYGKSEHTYTPGANENMPGGGPGISQAELDASMERLNQALAPYNARDRFKAIEGGASPVARYVPDKT
jgi:hypothetical protein